MMINKISKIYILTALLSFALVFSGTNDANAKVLPVHQVEWLQKKICGKAARNTVFTKEVNMLVLHWRSSTQRSPRQRLTPKSFNCVFEAKNMHLARHLRNIRDTVWRTNIRIRHRDISFSRIIYGPSEREGFLELRFKITY